MNGWQTKAAVLCVLTGTVFDSQHHPVASAKVYLQAADQKEITAQTDAAGVYRFSVPGGIYKVHVEGESAITVTAKTATTTLDVTVQPAFFDEPKFTAAGVTDYTYQGGHGSNTVLQSARTLAKDLQAEKESSGDPREMELFKQGTELLNHRATQAAVQAFTKGVNQFPRSVRLLLGLASACYSMGSYEEAARWFYKATDVAPSDSKPYLFLGKVEARQITEGAGYKERMERFAHLHPTNALANYYYGCTLPDDKARKVFAKTVELDPKFAPAYLKLGIISAREDHFAEAIRSYKRAIEIDPSLGEAHYRLSEAYRVTGELDKAKAEMRVFQSLTK
jgi:tetratricopeptide (TPR) repeat protein